MKQKGLAETLFRILPISQESLEELHKKGELKGKVEKLIVLLRRDYARVFHSDQNQKDRDLLDKIMKEINPRLDEIKGLDESDYSYLLNEVKGFELNMSITPEKLQELSDTTSALEDLVTKTEELQREVDELRKKSPSAEVINENKKYEKKVNFYTSFIETYVEYLCAMDSLTKDSDTNMTDPANVLQIKKGVRKLKTLAQTNGQLKDGSIRKVINYAEDMFNQIKKRDFEVLDETCSRYEQISKKSFKKMPDSQKRKIQDTIKRCINTYELYNLGA